MKDGHKMDNNQRARELYTENVEYAKIGDTADLKAAGATCKGGFALYFQSCLSNFSLEDLLSETLGVAAARWGEE